MCGRFVGAFSADLLMDEMSDALSEASMTVSFGEDSLFAPNYNTAPTHIVPILRNEESSVIVDQMQWGLVPSWSKDPSVGFDDRECAFDGHGNSS